MMRCVILALALSAVPASAAQYRTGTSTDIKFKTEGQKVVALDHDGKTQMLLEVKASGPACEKITCKDGLVCPPGFKVTKVDGHCCPYCINPDITIEPEVTGAVGKAGGKASTFCDNVWCFPTMCNGEEENPTSSNGMCCPKCTDDISAKISK
eukprot:TRINITY_DN343_c0_g1_i2.p1 TRINITY_DN343_c0_g1~~TRINITY_DN343_c0_g1_i2.p1  ORF type:complete len:153 (+),score=49.53 TRINITY_DN343_c0_g1_i2:78-536(+)